MTFTPPVADQILAIQVSAGIDEIVANERFAAATPDLVEAIVEGIGAFASGEWAPLNRVGDQVGAKWSDGRVTLPAGFVAAYKAFVEQGWARLPDPRPMVAKPCPSPWPPPCSKRWAQPTWASRCCQS